MPSFAFASAVRVTSHDRALRLKITHNLVHGPPSDVVHAVKGRPPKDLDVLWLSDVTVVLSGSLDGRPVPAHDAARSGLALHLHMQFRAARPTVLPFFARSRFIQNADHLGLNNVSRPFVDDTDGLAKLTLTPSRPLPHTSRPHANLVSLHLDYIWRTLVGRSNVVDSGRLVPEADPFSPTLFLPAEALLNRVTEQFMIYHVVGRYPLIFGPWYKRLDLEMQHFPSIGRSLVEMISRSQNRWFVSKCRRLLKIARRQHKFVIQSSTAAISPCIGDSTSNTSEGETDDLDATSVLTDEQVLCENLEQLFRVGVPQRRFKPAASPQFMSVLRDDEDGLLMLEDGTDQEDCWVELPEICMSPPAALKESHEGLPEDVDIFAGEDDREDGMWRLDEVDMGQRICESDGQSGEPLISAILATTSTDSQRACSVALSPKQQSAASGLRRKVSQLALLEDPETSNLTRPVSDALHDQYYSAKHGLLGACQVGWEDEDEWILSEEGAVEVLLV